MTTCTIDADLAALLDYGAAVVKVARRDKFPLGKAWNTLATSIADVIDEWLGQGYNLGLLCGSGNLIDVEYDDATGRETLKRMGLLDIETPTTLGTPKHCAAAVVQNCSSSKRGKAKRRIMSSSNTATTAQQSSVALIML